MNLCLVASDSFSKLQYYVGNKEVDFVAIHDGLKEYYQVSLTVQDEKTYQREIAPFLEIKDNYPKYVLSMDNLTKFNIDGIERKKIIDFLLE